MADFSIKQGGTQTFSTTITDPNGNAYNLTGSTVNFIMRLTTNAAVTVNASATVTDATAGWVSYTFRSTDTAIAGVYNAEFVAVDGSVTYTYPNDGYLEIAVEESLSDGMVDGATLISIGEAKDYLEIPTSDRSRDAKLLRFIRNLTPVVEAITGPILPRIYDEWYDGGQHFVRLRRRPVLTLMAVSEFRGPIEYPLMIIQQPTEGQIYSCQLDLNRVVRRSAGGGIVAFPPMPQAVHCVYQAGFQTVPANVTEGALELVRLNFQQTQQGRPRPGSDNFGDDEPRGPMLGFFVPGRVREMLLPNRHHAGVA